LPNRHGSGDPGFKVPASRPDIHSIAKPTWVRRPRVQSPCIPTKQFLALPRRPLFRKPFGSLLYIHHFEE